MDLFRDQPFTIDYRSQQLVLEDEASVAARREAGSTTRVRIENDGPSTVLYLPLVLSAETAPLEMEVDSGSRDLILDERFMSKLGLKPDGASVKRVDGTDETGHSYVRFFAALPHAARVVGATDVEVPANSTVMFQRIIHDGLVGHAFLSAHNTTFDLAHAMMIFAPSR